jgi:hypothetical protein
MNERIWDFYGQALVGPVGEGDEVLDPVKFAELIVQSCLTQIALIGISNLENDGSGDIGWTVNTSIDMIKEHFGVKE